MNFEFNLKPSSLQKISKLLTRDLINFSDDPNTIHQSLFVLKKAAYIIQHSYKRYSISTLGRDVLNKIDAIFDLEVLIPNATPQKRSHGQEKPATSSILNSDPIPISKEDAMKLLTPQFSKLFKELDLKISHSALSDAMQKLYEYWTSKAVLQSMSDDYPIATVKKILAWLTGDASIFTSDQIAEIEEVLKSCWIDFFT